MTPIPAEFNEATEALREIAAYEIRRIERQQFWQTFRYYLLWTLLALDGAAFLAVCAGKLMGVAE